jgi:hypothetical protein
MSDGVRISSDQLECIRPILREWVKINERLGEEWSDVGDAPWWHIERALVSLFAGAIWRSRGDAFEEYAEDKRGERSRAGGRIDLWFSQRRGKDFKAEAKQCWVKSDSNAKSLEKVIECMESARRDAGNLSPDGMRRLAIVFGAALVPKHLNSDLPAQIESMVELAQNKSIKADAAAWVFPRLKRPLVSSDGFILPGIIIWLREVHRSPQK